MHKFYSRILPLFLVTIISYTLPSCFDDEDTVWDQYKDWRELNQEWFLNQSTLTNPDGTSFYTHCVMPTDPQAYVLMHTFGTPNTQNLTPLFSSSTLVNYTLKLANDSVIDQGTNFSSQLSSSDLITGWSLAIMNMHVGDSAQFIIPYNVGYGAYGSTMVPPYSNLQFNIRLLDITHYETRP